MKAQEVGKVYDIPTNLIAVFKGQPRWYFDPLKMNELEASIARFKQRKPGKVKILYEDQRGYDCELIDGERRLRVCKKLGITFRAWVVDDVPDERSQFLDAVMSNYGGEEHAELETFDAIIRVRKENPDFTIADTAAAFGCSVATITSFLSLRKLDPEVLRMMDRNLPESQRLKFTQALALVDCTPERQRFYAGMTTSKGLKTKQLKEIVERHSPKASRGEDYSPRRDHEKFVNFLQRTTVDLELILRQPKNHFATMFEHRNPNDLRVAAGMVKRSVEGLAMLAETLERLKTGGQERKAG